VNHSSKNLNSFRTQLNQLGQFSIPFLFLIDFEMKCPVVYPLEQIPQGFLYNFNGLTNYNDGFVFNQQLDLNIEPVDFHRFKIAFESVKRELNYGNSFLLNLAFKSRIFPDLGLLDIYYKSRAKYKFLWPDKFVVFSPESFVSIKEGIISSYPMKGTIDASIPNAKHLILHNKKEIAEHYTIVDLIRNDLSMVAKNVHVKRFRYVDHIQTNQKNLYQVSSEVVGTLPTNYAEHIGDLLLSLLPAGSISGAPKAKTVEIIQSVEGELRGYYTGICGIFDGKSLDSGVMIRFIEKEEDKFYYRSGGGITFQSELEKEYQELIDKVYVPLV
jgi:para-aminobenzoate synthetase component 1